ncbi:HlyD family efflux transporter periplasmic adaptor subunit [bacterium]|nr:HlyD family efflux transporter periplasmic adaptor subunit [bacterium]
MKRFLQVLALILLLGGLAAGAVAWYNPGLAHQVTATVTNFLGLGPVGANTERYEVGDLLGDEFSSGETSMGATNSADALPSGANISELSQSATVTRGDLRANVNVVGQLTAKQQAELKFDRLSSTAPLLTLAAEPGAFVEPGHLLASIDPTTYEQALAQAQKRLEEATRALTELKTPPSESIKAQAALSVAKAELDLQQALTDLDNVDNPPNVTEQQLAVAKARDDLLLAQNRQPLADYDALDKSIRDLEYTIAWNQRRYWELEELMDNYTANLEEMQEQAQLETKIPEQEAELARLQALRQTVDEGAAGQVTTAQSALAKAQQDLTRAMQGNGELVRTEAVLAVQKSAVALQKARDEAAKLAAGPDATKLAAAESAVADAQQAVANTEADLAATVLVAPFAGTVLSVASSQGSRITASSPILTLANLSQLQVVAGVDETMIRQVQKGQRVSLTFDALPGQQFSGEVLSVPLQGRLQGDVMVYSVPISIGDVDGDVDELNLKVGMTANVEIGVGEVTGALLVPKMAVQQRAGGYVVLTPNPDPAGAPLEIPVDVGLSDGIFTEIRSGLNEGDSIIVPLDKGEEEFPFGMMGF